MLWALWQTYGSKAGCFSFQFRFYRMLPRMRPCRLIGSDEALWYKMESAKSIVGSGLFLCKVPIDQHWRKVWRSFLIVLVYVVECSVADCFRMLLWLLICLCCGGSCGCGFATWQGLQEEAAPAAVGRLTLPQGFAQHVCSQTRGGKPGGGGYCSCCQQGEKLCECFLKPHLGTESDANHTAKKTNLELPWGQVTLNMTKENGPMGCHVCVGKTTKVCMYTCMHVLYIARLLTRVFHWAEKLTGSCLIPFSLATIRKHSSMLK